ncbi:MAG: hypothetical protein HY063_10220 [Bacteroidetes bacterium]|nr:hypothetical protein [Bacteroidota bacterium]
MKFPSKMGFSPCWPFILFFTTAIIFSNCGNEKTCEQKKELKKDSFAKDTLVKTEKKKIYERKYNDIARFIAGMPADSNSTLDSSLLVDKEWQKFSKNMEARWQKYDSTRLQKISAWAKKEIPDSVSHTLFYPFSGPDFLNAEIFFPNSDTMVLVGLEPRGKIPVIRKNSSDSLEKYLNEVERSLNSILNFSFFRTLSMKKDLEQKEVNGTIPVMLLFLVRTGNFIENIQMIYLAPSGKIIYSDAEADSIKTQGVEITFHKTGEEKPRILFYFSVDLSDAGVKNKTPQFVSFVNELGTVTTFLKSASYLMHKNYFSVIRSLILKQSDLLLQDDSGIPLKFFSDSIWNNKFYGTYTGTIPMFSAHKQEDLVKAYQDKTNVKSLEFGIGYRWHKNESNLMLSKKKKK